MARRSRTTPKKKKPPRSRPLFVTLFFVAAFLVLGAYILRLPIWGIKEVVVNGAKMLSSEEIRALAGVPISENLFFSSFARAENNLSKITAIKSCRFYRIPPATVLISITERKPLAALIFPEKSAVIDVEGFILNRNQNITLNIPGMADLPVVSGIEEGKFLKNDRVDEKVSHTVSSIILKLLPYQESSKMQLELGGLENVSFLLDDLLRVKLGRAEDIKQKMEIFEALLPVIDGKWAQVEYVDVRYPENPAIKYK